MKLGVKIVLILVVGAIGMIAWKSAWGDPKAANQPVHFTTFEVDSAWDEATRMADSFWKVVRLDVLPSSDLHVVLENRRDPSQPRRFYNVNATISDPERFDYNRVAVGDVLQFAQIDVRQKQGVLNDPEVTNLRAESFLLIYQINPKEAAK